MRSLVSGRGSPFSLSDVRFRQFQLRLSAILAVDGFGLGQFGFGNARDAKALPYFCD